MLVLVYILFIAFLSKNCICVLLYPFFLKVSSTFLNISEVRNFFPSMNVITCNSFIVAKKHSVSLPSQVAGFFFFHFYPLYFNIYFLLYRLWRFEKYRKMLTAASHLKCVSLSYRYSDAELILTGFLLEIKFCLMSLNSHFWYSYVFLGISQNSCN